MKLYNEWIFFFRDYNLMELIIIEKGKKKLMGNNLVVYYIVDEFLVDYGICFSLSIKYIDFDIIVRVMRLDEDFFLENYFFIE